MLVELVELHHLHRAGHDLGEEPAVDLRAVELAGDDERLQVAVVDRVADVGQRAEIGRVERRGVEVPVVRHDRGADLEAAGLLAIEFLPQPHGGIGRADHTDPDACGRREDPARDDQGGHSGNRGEGKRQERSGLVHHLERDDREDRAQDGHDPVRQKPRHG